MRIKAPALKALLTVVCLLLAATVAYAITGDETFGWSGISPLAQIPEFAGVAVGGLAMLLVARLVRRRIQAS